MLFKSKRKKQEEEKKLRDDILINGLGDFIYRSLIFDNKNVFISGYSPFIYPINENTKINVFKFVNDYLTKSISFVITIGKYDVVGVVLFKNKKNKWVIESCTKYYEIPEGAITEIRSWICWKILESDIKQKEYAKVCEEKDKKRKERHNKIQEYINNLYRDKGENK